ncbi:type I-G CRISPR-associated helicase/endonuclease Cas3g [Yunchengibacter salinarum]|uniref:type I-G CRISPR-associated helicase/endonuclease Cas3g n=1 Tax=Yunchengibacter salinarum TaxID=3133399 RepID=UPI0035B69078
MDVSQETGSTALFQSRFQALTGHSPFRWQVRLFHEFTGNCRPDALDLPTGAGKTSVMVIWYLAREAGATDLPRRLVYVVDRRAVVDQATVEAEKIRTWAATQGGDLPISTLRGQYADRGDWLRDPSAPAIIVGTVDMIGSRLLFGGYGVSRRMRPYHAGLLGMDSLIVLDESHLVPPFERLVEQITKRASRPEGEDFRQLAPPVELLTLSATGRREGESVFRLNEEEKTEGPVRERLTADKSLRFESIDTSSLPQTLAERAWALTDEGNRPGRILIYCNRRADAEETLAAIRKLAKSLKLPEENTQLLVGARRVHEREEARRALDQLGFFSGGVQSDLPAFLVATSAGEVGVDLDADHMVMDLVPIERMVQRLGRVNRLGNKQSDIIVLHGDVPSSDKDHDHIAEATRKLLGHLPEHTDGSLNASPQSLMELMDEHWRAVVNASTPAPLYPALNRPLLEAWSMTSLRDHTGRPEIQPWLRGWVDEQEQTSLVWRRHLPVRTDGGVAEATEIDTFFTAAPPHLAERLETQTDHVCDWLKKRVRAAAKHTGPCPADMPIPLWKQGVVAFALDRTNDVVGRFSLAELSELLRTKKNAVTNLSGKTLVLDARIGGLSNGLLADKTHDPAPSADDENGWLSPPDDANAAPRVPVRVLRSSASVNPDADSEGDAATEPENWQPVHSFVTATTEEGAPTSWLVVEKWHGEDSSEDARAITRKSQSLEEHQGWVAEEAKRLVAALGLTHSAPEIADAVCLAARYHDEGKRSRVWQNAFNAPKADGPYAKTRGPVRPSILQGYRHEFGSVLALDGHDAPEALPETIRDLTLHLIAAHHGQARPTLSVNGCDSLPPSALADKAQEVALRFARLQDRFDPWGLAWLEAVVRAADQRASRRLDQAVSEWEGNHG